MKRTLTTKEIQYLRIKIKATEVQQLTMHILKGKSGSPPPNTSNQYKPALSSSQLLRQSFSIC